MKVLLTVCMQVKILFKSGYITTGCCVYPLKCIATNKNPMIDGDSMVITNELHGLTQLSKQILKGHHA